MEYFLAIIDLFDALENEEARPKDTSNLEYKKMNKKKMQLPTLRNGLIQPHFIIWKMKQIPIISRRNWNQHLTKNCWK